MPGHFGTTDSEDGVFASADSSKQVGVFGNNTSTSPPPAGGTGGAGVFGLTVSPGAAGVFGANNSDKGVGVQGNGPEVGVRGFSKDGIGIRGDSSEGFTAVHGNGGKNGVWGYTTSANDSGVYGSNDGSGNGVAGFSKNGTGLRGSTQSSANFGVFGSNDSSNTPTGGGAGGAGVFGLSISPGRAGVFGANSSNKGVGVQGNGPDVGVSGFRDRNTGVVGTGAKNGVVGRTGSDVDAGVNGRNDGKGFGVFGGSLNGSGVEGHSTNGTGVVGFSEKSLAGRFIGDVEVTGDIRLTNADCAEDFDVVDITQVTPGTVMVIDSEGALRPSDRAYDKRVAGVISGAGKYKPAIVLDKQESSKNRMPIALMGKVYCKVDASYGAIEVGDLLTTSPTPGHAMKADDPMKAFGAVIGKALRPLEVGQDLIGSIPLLQKYVMSVRIEA